MSQDAAQTPPARPAGPPPFPKFGPNGQPLTPPRPTTLPPLVYHPTPPVVTQPAATVTEFDADAFDTSSENYAQDGFPLESDTAKWFDDMVERTECFRILREVTGHYVHPRPHTPSETARIDRILIPNARAVQLGLNDVIGVELKASKVKLGPVAAQATDYTRCAFEDRELTGLVYMPRWVFVCPYKNPGGPVASMMTQNRIGTAGKEGWSLKFCCGTKWAIKIAHDGEIEFRKVTDGNRSGSRSAK